jgi:signal transduction histidine kinase/DNA-binding response OmpR family regulator/HPt (histidine-containing phosphotransfer) domain-containing protein
LRAALSAKWLLFCVPLLLLVLSASARAQDSEVLTFADAKSRLVLAVLSNSQWPDEEEIDEFLIGVYGNNRELLRALERDAAKQLARGKPVAVKRFDDLDEAATSHILLLLPQMNNRLAELRERFRGTDTLLVTDGAEDRANIMVNFTYPSGDRVAFEISASNMIEAGLTPSREILLFGGDKGDLAEVYVKTEQRLAEASALVEQQQGRLEEQQRRLEEQSGTIARQLEEMASNRQELAAFETQLAGVQQLLADSVAQIGTNARELAEKEKVLADKEANIEENQQRLEAQRRRLEAQQESIAAQEQQIREQDAVLMTQLGTIEIQKYFLIGTASGLMLVSLLIVLTFRAYRSKHNIAVQLEAKTGELEVANRKLLEVTEAKSLFVSTMSHEIRTPMNGVIGIAELLEGTKLTAQQEEYVALILKSADTLLGLINDILDFSKIEAGHLELEAIPFSVREVLGDTLQTLALRANEKGLELTLHIPPEVPEWLVGDPLRLRQVLVNLVGNAIKFTETAEVAVALSRTESESGAGILFEVRDTGIGISEAQQRKIFEAFSQADSSTTRRFGGTGLGLSIAGQIVRMMGGELAVRSTPGQGSTFHFTATFAVADAPEPVALPAELFAGRRVLVVDDNETNRRILEEMLRNWGMHVHSTVSGADALAYLDRAQNTPEAAEIVLLDVMMPEMDGLEVAARIRQRPAMEELSIVLLTSAGRPDAEELREHLSVSQVLLKPAKQSKLLEAVASALGHSSSPAPVRAESVTGSDRELRILLTEDHPVNRRVATEMLGRRGHRVEVAENGREAVEQSSRREYDLILMDVHMPVMDGLTATRLIREREHGSGSHVPIIALTAGATLEDRENCLSAGMDGFVSKPFRADDLLRTVEELIAGRGVPPALPAKTVSRADAGTTGADPTGTSPTGTAPIDAAPTDDEPCLDWPTALRNLDGDEEFLRELGGMFLEQYPAALEAIAAAVERGDSKELEQAAHALKGSSRIVGAGAVAASALELETLGHAGKAAAAGEALERLRHHLAQLGSALAAELERG